MKWKNSLIKHPIQRLQWKSENQMSNMNIPYVFTAHDLHYNEVVSLAYCDAYSLIFTHVQPTSFYSVINVIQFYMPFYVSSHSTDLDTHSVSLSN